MNKNMDFDKNFKLEKLFDFGPDGVGYTRMSKGIFIKDMNKER